MNKKGFAGVAAIAVLALFAAACRGERESVEAPTPGLTRTATAVSSPAGATETPNLAATTPTPEEAGLATPQAAQGMVIVRVAQDNERPLPAVRISLIFKDLSTGRRLAEPVTQLTDASGQAVFNGKQILSSQLASLPLEGHSALADVIVEAEALRAEEEVMVDLQGGAGAVLWFNQCGSKLLLERSSGVGEAMDPTEERIQQVREIYEALPKPLPSGENWEIQYETSGPVAGYFHITVDARSGDEAYISGTIEALDAFRSLGYEPCSLPLRALLAVSAVHPATPGPPSPGSGTWEPCKETCSE